MLGKSLSNKMPALGLRLCKRYGLVLQLGLPDCYQGSLIQGAGAGAADCFLIYSVAFLFLHVFQLSCPSLVVLGALPFIFSSDYSPVLS
jgi:hypothetical protein